MAASRLREDYEAAVLAIARRTAAMKREGKPVEEIARAAHEDRRWLAISFKARTPEPLRSKLHRRTLAAYGDPFGPTVETLRARGKTWEEIAESASRPGRFPFSFDGENEPATPLPGKPRGHDSGRKR